MSNKLDRPLEDIIKENKKKQPGQKGQKTFGKRGAPGKKFARPVIAKKGRTNDKRESRTNVTIFACASLLTITLYKAETQKSINCFEREIYSQNQRIRRSHRNSRHKQKRT